MKTEQIAYLDDISRTHSITQTAQRFFISQQALSVSLTKLEEEFGTTFLVRTNKGAYLTEDGLFFLQNTQPILDRYKELKESFFLHSTAATDETISPEGHLVIFCHTRILEPLLIDLLEQYTRKYPHVHITLYEKENIDIITAIAQQAGDFGLIFTPEFLFDNTGGYQLPAHVQVEELFSDHFIVCCSANHPLKQQKSLSMHSFQGFPAILFDTNKYVSQSDVLPLPDTEGHCYYSNNASFHKAMISRGMAISLITAFEFRKLYFKHKDLIALPITDSPKSIINLVLNKKEPPSQAAQLFINLLKKYNFYGI